MNESKPDKAVGAAVGPRWRVSDKEAYLAADLVCQGKGATQVGDILFGDAKPHVQENTRLMRVERLLLHAKKKSILSLRCPESEELHDALVACYKGVDFHVANNDSHIYESGRANVDKDFRSDAVCRLAAEIVALQINKLLAKRAEENNNAPIIVANAGGLVASKTAKFLPGFTSIQEEHHPEKLLFISLNSASIPNEYGLSANLVAYNMAELYGGKHIAHVPSWSKEIEEDYQKKVQGIDILICGSGSKKGILFTRQRKSNEEIPSQAVGDICLIPIDKDGAPVALSETVRQDHAQHLRPNPDYDTLHRLAGDSKVIFIALGHQTEEFTLPNKSESSNKLEHSKLEVTHAILKGKLASTCILGVTLAKELIAKNKAQAPTVPAAST